MPSFSNWYIMAPVARASRPNLCANPAFMMHTNGWSNVLRLATADPTEFIPPFCGRLTAHSGAYYDFVCSPEDETAVAAQDFTISAYIKSTSGHSITLRFMDATGTTTHASTAYTASGGWERKEVTYLATPGTTYRLRVDGVSTVTVVTGVLIHEGSSAEDYFDGDSPDCYWTGVPHGSISRRHAGLSHVAGTYYHAEQLGFRVEQVSGAGALEVINDAAPLAVGDGASYRRSRNLSRRLILSGVIGGNVDDAYDGTSAVIGSTNEELHVARQTVIDTLRAGQMVRIKYTGGGSQDLELFAYYDGGLGFDKRRGNAETVTVQIVATDPAFYGQWKGVDLANQNAPGARTMTRVRDDRFSVSTPATTIRHLARGRDGLYMAADNEVYKYDGVRWSQVGATFGAAVHFVAMGPDGTLYCLVVGTGTNLDVYSYDGSTWSSYDPAAGDTTTTEDFIVPKANTPIVADGASDLSQASTSGTLAYVATNGDVDALSLGPFGYLYYGGNFTTHTLPTSTTENASRIGYRDLESSGGTTLTVLGTLAGGVNGAVTALAYEPGGPLYVFGSFTTAGGLSAVSAAMWNGYTWRPMGDGPGITPNRAVVWDGKVYVTSSTAAVSAVWDGARWHRYYHSVVATPAVGAFGRALFIGTASSTFTVAGETTVASASTAEAYPTFYLRSTHATLPTALYRIVNTASGRAIHFDYTLEPGEILIVRCGPRVDGPRLISSYYGPVPNAIKPGAALATFAIEPGARGSASFTNADNVLSVYFQYLSTVTTTMVYRDRFVSYDAGAL